MRFLIVTHVLHKRVGDRWFGYGPYVKEVNLWLKHVDEVVVLAPRTTAEKAEPIDLAYIHPKINVVGVPEFDTLTWPARLRLLWQFPMILLMTLFQMGRADHIHLRCPGNMGLIGCLAQVFFSKKRKSAKYAGNWDPKSPQPMTYRWQRNILASERWTKNMKVLVYGEWGESSRNLLDFFTASYSDSEQVPTPARDLLQPLRLIFVGSLVHGKNPMISCQAAKMLRDSGVTVQLHLYGEGRERPSLEDFLAEYGLENEVTLHGNVPGADLKQAYAESHFLLFASESEGWPKAVAEAMFWGCLPLTTAVSCVPQMVGQGSRGDLVEKDPQALVDRIAYYLDHPADYKTKVQRAMSWSREYTLEKFEAEIKKVLLD